MSTQQNSSAKAVSSNDQSDAIVVSFGYEWHKHILASSFSIVLRKRIPSKCTKFKWIYMHVNSPIGAICARAAITQISHISLNDAIDWHSEINLPEKAIRSYIGTSDTIGAYRIDKIELTSDPLNTATINEQLVYFPPQSFFILSIRGKEVLDELAGFSRRKSSQTRKGQNK
jgi:predicted transcriptional regulator